MLIGGLVFMFVTLSNHFRAARLDKQSIETTATITKHFTTRAAKSSIDEYQLQATYSDKSGKSFTLNQTVTVDFWNVNPEGTSVAVRYLPDDPNVAEIKGGTIAQNIVLYLVIAGVAAAAGAVLLFFSFRIK